MKQKQMLPPNKIACKHVYELFQSVITQWTAKYKTQHSVQISAPLLVNVAHYIASVLSFHMCQIWLLAMSWTEINKCVLSVWLP